VPEARSDQRECYRIQLRGAEGAFLVDHVLRSGACFENPELTSDEEDGECAILTVRDHFLKELGQAAVEDRRRLTDYILRRCHVVAIVTTDIDHGHRMFSVLNDRGRPLARKDIIKAEVLGDVSPERIDTLLQRWSEVERSLGTQFDNFFSHVRTVGGHGKLPIITGIRAVREDCGSSERFFDDVLIPLADAFEFIQRGEHAGAPESAEITRRLTYLSWLGTSDWVPPTMLWVRRHRNSPAEILRFLELMDRFSYSLRLLCIGTNKRAGRYNDILLAIHGGTLFDPKSTPCILDRDEQRHITYNLYNLYERHPLTCKLVLLRLNDELAGAPQNLDPKEWTVEHVLPQSPGRKSLWRTWFPDPNERDSFARSLGNLVLVRRSQNDRASNQELDHKQAVYFSGRPDSMPVITREIATARQWGPAEIRSREERFLRILSRIWGLELMAGARGSDRLRPLSRERKAG
jgi:hypothetical protein